MVSPKIPYEIQNIFDYIVKNTIKLINELELFVFKAFFILHIRKSGVMKNENKKFLIFKYNTVMRFSFSTCFRFYENK